MHRHVFRSGYFSGSGNFPIARIFNDNIIENAGKTWMCYVGKNFNVRRKFSLTHQQKSLIQYGNEVEEARKANLPIVALESTIITHGMPYPDNLDTATRVEEIIRQQGAVPATIAICDGKLQVGMNHDRLEKLAKCAIKGNENGEKAIKCSRRDISTAICQKFNGGTTVGGTMTIARMAGIPIMATGGIGGVHRGAELTMDVSSDLIELSRNPVAVVCAGVKAILDIPKTLEYLETQGVPVITIAETDNFPAFYSRETSSSNPLKAPSRVSGAEEAAKLLHIQEQLGLKTGMLFAVPIPESHALDSTAIESIIREALAMAETRGIRGKYVTPYLLQQLNELTSGGFLKANQALVENNARVAAEMALALSHLKRKDEATWMPRVQQPSTAKPPPAVIGGAAVDVVLHVDHPQIQLDGRTHRGKSRQSFGGVGRNIAAALVALGLENTRFITAVGKDDAGRAIAENLGHTGEDIELLSNADTPRYTVILDKNGECQFGVGEMDTFAAIDENLVIKHRSSIEKAGIIVIDGNISLETMRTVIEIAASNKIPVWFEPTDISKATRIFQTKSEWMNNDRDAKDKVLQFVSPNVNELVAIAKYLGIESSSEESNEYPSIEWISKLAKGLAEYVPVVITTLGSRGVLVTRRGSMLETFFNPSEKLGESSRVNNDSIQSRLYPAPEVKKQDSSEKFSVSGCGDCLVAAIISGSYRGLNESECLSFALEAAAVSLKSYEPVPRALEELRNFSISPNFNERTRTIN